jgi:hypothetical protein
MQILSTDMTLNSVSVQSSKPRQFAFKLSPLFLNGLKFHIISYTHMALMCNLSMGNAKESSGSNNKINDSMV